METSPRFFNASLRKSLKVLKSCPRPATASHILSSHAHPNKNEVIVLDATGQFYGKIELHSLIGKPESSKIEKFVDTNCVTIKHDASLQQAMEAAANFVGEAIPIINRETNQVISVITEGAIFDAYLKVQYTVQQQERVTVR